MSELLVTLQGTQYRANKLGIGYVYREVSDYMIRQYARRVTLFVDELHEQSNGRAETRDFAESLRSQVGQELRRGFTSYDTDEWMMTIEGICYVMWMALRENHPELTLDKCQQIFDSLDPNELKILADIRSHAQGFKPDPSQPGETPATQTETVAAGHSPTGEE